MQNNLGGPWQGENVIVLEDGGRGMWGHGIGASSYDEIVRVLGEEGGGKAVGLSGRVTTFIDVVKIAQKLFDDAKNYKMIR